MLAATIKRFASAASSAAIVMYFAAVPASAVAEPEGLRSGSWTLSLAARQPIPIVHGDNAVAQVAHPLMAEFIDEPGRISRLTGAYARVEQIDKRFEATGSLTTPSGSVLEFTDLFDASDDHGDFLLDRTVTVRHSEPADKGFRTEFSVGVCGAVTLADVQPFVPGIWYCDASHVPPAGLISDPAQNNYLFREDRLPLPLAMIRERAAGVTVCLIHDHPDGATFAAENTAETFIDERLQFASLGVTQDAGVDVALAFPGVEKDQSRVGSQPGRVPSQRFHPFRQGFAQHWQMIVHLSEQPNFDAALRDAWRTAYDAFSPAVVRLPMERVYAASIDVLDHYGAERHGVMGFPFAVTLPEGKVRDVSYQMGFVGEQIPLAAHLIAAGFARPQPGLVEKGEKIVDFWAANCLLPGGLPRTWYDVDPRPHWRDYKTFTRIATDGMEGMLQAWRRMALDGRDKPYWLACCLKYGQWLLDRQNPDGSYFRQYADNGTPLNESKSAALQPVRFLVDLTNATGDNRFLAAAQRAGQFAERDIADNANYYGGTADNNDVKDKEAGWIALDSFLSLYEATGERAWLISASRAADFTETWTYCWNVPIDRTAPRVTFPRIKTTAGMSLIATGRSAADVFLAFAPYAYYRLALYTGDAHYAAIARLLLENPRQLVDCDGSLGYATPGLLTEAFSLAPPRGQGVNVWLPWCSAAVLDPMQQFQDAFGSMDLDRIKAMDSGMRERMLLKFAQRHGFPGIHSKQ